jgi:hypothetical protein
MLYLIDFGVSRKYKNADGTHVQFRMDLSFTGNIIFASVNSFLNYGKYFYLLIYDCRTELKRRLRIPSISASLPSPRPPAMAELPRYKFPGAANVYGQRAEN